MQFSKDILVATPWKNGGGVTRVIATSPEAHAYWRMSIANVDQHGEFSLFPGLRRILTVIQGNGMQLKGKELTLQAEPHKPVSFDGEQGVHGYLLDGPVQNFNLIFDAKSFDAQVLVGPAHSLSGTISPDVDVAMIYCLAGAVQTGSAGLLQAHAGAFLVSTDEFEATSESDIGLWIGLRRIRS